MDRFTRKRKAPTTYAEFKKYHVGTPARAPAPPRAAARRPAKPRAPGRPGPVMQVPKLVLGQPAHFDKSKSSFSFSRKKDLSNKVLTNLSSVNIFEANYPSRLQALSGQQAANSFYFADAAPLTTMFNQIAAENPGPNITRKMYLEGIYACIEYANASTAPCHFSLYDLHYKQDMNLGSNINNLSPEGCWNASEVEQGDATGLSSIMSYPSKLARFNKYYSIDKKTDLTLLPGEVHTHKVYLSPNCWVKALESQDYLRLKKCTRAVMLAVHGTPADPTGATDVSGSVLDPSGNPTYAFAVGSISTSPVAINSIMKVRYTYRWMSDTDSDIVAINNITPLPAAEVVNLVGSAIAATTA